MNANELLHTLFPQNESRVKMVKKKLGKKYLADLESFLKKREKKDISDEEAEKIDSDLLSLILQAPEKHLHGYLISLKFLRPKEELNPLEMATRSAFFQENPAYIHELAERLAAPGNRKDLYFLRQILLYTPFLADHLKLYYQQIEKAKKQDPVDAELLSWIEEMYLKIENILAEVESSYPVVFHYRWRLGMQHLAFREHFHLLLIT